MHAYSMTGCGRGPIIMEEDELTLGGKSVCHLIDCLTDIRPVATIETVRRLPIKSVCSFTILLLFNHLSSFQDSLQYLLNPKHTGSVTIFLAFDFQHSMRPKIWKKLHRPNGYKIQSKSLHILLSAIPIPQTDSANQFLTMIKNGELELTAIFRELNSTNTNNTMGRVYILISPSTPALPRLEISEFHPIHN